jgi:voltage-gated potassium channel
MPRQGLRWMAGLAGVGGVPAHDNPRAYLWERRLHPVMIVVALIALPAAFIDDGSVDPLLRTVAHAVDLFIVLAFVLELGWMLHVVRQRRRYLMRNWLDVLIIAAAVVSLTGVESGWLVLARFARVAVVGMMLVRVLGSLRTLYSPDALPLVFAFAIVSVLVGGAGFYVLEPTVNTFGDGVWLAFATGTTIGYGDFVPTTTAARLWAAVMVLLGFAMLSLLTATLVTMIVGQDETRLRREMHNDIRMLRDEVRALRDQLQSPSPGAASSVAPTAEAAPAAAPGAQAAPPTGSPG